MRGNNFAAAKLLAESPDYSFRRELCSASEAGLGGSFGCDFCWRRRWF
jgi:hypothetical protein